ncbi:MAG: hypothetical protein KF784_04550 [Fimbriimonadaceae bacterium]|nr:hypothetical protein [Fimbriimonadaceae bacterium]
MIFPTPGELLADVVRRLDGAGIDYFVGGSFAAIMYGLRRTTRDIDMVFAARANTLSKLIQAFSGDYYVDEVAFERAIKERDCFNLIHEGSGFQFDVFFPPESSFLDMQFERRIKIAIPLTDPPVQGYFASPEDTLLAKLYWYRISGGGSKVQWEDALAICAVQTSRLDKGYLQRTAAELGLSDLLVRVLQESRE